VERISQPVPASAIPDRALKPRGQIGKTAAVLVLAIALCACWAFRRPWFQGNLATVDAGRVLRSAQPTARLAEWIRDYRLRSILNLRGGSLADPWYAAEVTTARACGVSFQDLPLSATRRPSRRELLALIDLLQGSPYPLLIHCKSGADRTGLATALYLMVVRGESPEQAERAFSLGFGHVPFGGPEHLHEPVREYASWLKVRGQPHTSDRFLNWLKSEYGPANGRVARPGAAPDPSSRRK
jgi:protein tyrosine phosphatase (PTP) superfamily phosphohydrolase (DUF442 family)